MSLSSVLLQNGEQLRAEPGEFIFLQGKPADYLYMIIMGSVGVYRMSTDGKSVVENSTTGAGKILAEYAVTRENSHMYTARALAPTQLIRIDAQKARELVQVLPPFAERVLSALEMRGISMSLSEISDIMQRAAMPRYGITASEDEQQYLTTRKITCPVCKKPGEHVVTRNSRLVLKGMDNDLRRNYDGIEVIWYSPIVCPHCNYANLISNYDKLSSMQVRNLQASEYSAKVPKFSGFSPLRTIDEVLEALYLILDCNSYYKATPMNDAQVWRRLAWLYMDLNETDLIDTSSQKTLDLYNKVFETRVGSSPGEEISLNISLAALYLMKGDKTHAYQHLSMNIKISRENPMAANSHASLINQSKNMVADLRDMEGA